MADDAKEAAAKQAEINSVLSQHLCKVLASTMAEAAQATAVQVAVMAVHRAKQLKDIAGEAGCWLGSSIRTASPGGGSLTPHQQSFWPMFGGKCSSGNPARRCIVVTRWACLLACSEACFDCPPLTACPQRLSSMAWTKRRASRATESTTAWRERALQVRFGFSGTSVPRKNPAQTRWPFYLLQRPAKLAPAVSPLCLSACPRCHQP